MDQGDEHMKTRHRDQFRRLSAIIFLVAGVLSFGSIPEARGGVLQVFLEDLPTFGFVGDPYTPQWRISNVHNRESVGVVSYTFLIVNQSSRSEVFRRTGSTDELGAGETETFVEEGAWVPEDAGKFVAILTANGEKNINGQQTDSVVIDITAPNCDAVPLLAPARTLYLGDDLTGDFTWSVQEDVCCFDLRATIVTGRDVLTLTPFGSTQQVTSATPRTWSATVDTSRFRPSAILVRFNWKECDGDRSGSEIVDIRFGNPPSGGKRKGPPPPLTGGNTIHAGTDGDPVNTFLGEFYFDGIDGSATPDLEVPGGSPLQFVRGYSSSRARAGVADNDMGRNWTHNFNWRLLTGPNEAFVIEPNGRVVRFYPDGSGGWTQDWQRNRGTLLAETAGGYQVYDEKSGTSVLFDSTGTLLALRDNLGNDQTVTRRPDGSFRVENRFGDYLETAVDALGRVVSVTDGTREVFYAYDDDLLSSFTNVMGESWRYLYDTSREEEALMTGITTPEGEWGLTTTYDADGRVSSQTDHTSSTWTFTYLPVDQDGSRVTVIDEPDGTSTRHRHDPAGNLLSLERGDTYRVGIEYDSEGRKIGLVDSKGESTVWEYDASGLMTKNRLPNGVEKTYESQTRQEGARTITDLFRVGLPGGQSQVLERSEGMVAGVITRQGRREVERNPWGAITKETAPDGIATLYEYDASGNLVLRVDRGNETEIEYDQLNRPIRYSTPRSETTLALRPDNQPSSITTEQGVTTYEYDRNGNLTRMNGPKGVRIFQYDAIGNLTSIAEVDGLHVSFEFRNDGTGDQLHTNRGDTIFFSRSADNEQRVAFGQGSRRTTTFDSEGILSEVEYADGSLEKYLSDKIGQLTSRIGTTTASREYGPFGEVTKISGLPGGDVQIGYNQAGFPTSIDRGNGSSVFALVTDPGGRVTSVTDPNGEEWLQEHDANGRVSSLSDPLGNQIEYRRDSTGLTVGVTINSGSERAIERGSNGLISAVGDGAGGFEAVRRDGAGRVDSARGFTAAYNQSGQITMVGDVSTSYVNGEVNEIEYSRGEKAQYNRETDEWSADIVGRQFSSLYNRDENLRTLYRPNGTSTEWRYDADQLVSITEYGRGNVLLSSIEIVERDEAGRPTLVNRDAPSMPSGNNATTGTFGYDAAGRRADGIYDGFDLTRIGDYAIESDPFGQITRINPDASTGESPVALSSDGIGNTTQITREGEEPITIVYGGVERNLLPLEVLVGSERHIIGYAPDQTPLMEDGPAGVQYLHFDERGSPSFVTDSSGNIVHSYAFTPTGEQTAGPTALNGSTIGLVSRTGATIVPTISLTPIGNTLRKSETGSPVVRYGASADLRQAPDNFPTYLKLGEGHLAARLASVFFPPVEEKKLQEDEPDPAIEEMLWRAHVRMREDELELRVKDDNPGTLSGATDEVSQTVGVLSDLQQSGRSERPGIGEAYASVLFGGAIINWDAMQYGMVSVTIGGETFWYHALEIYQFVKKQFPHLIKRVEPHNRKRAPEEKGAETPESGGSRPGPSSGR